MALALWKRLIMINDQFFSSEESEHSKKEVIYLFNVDQTDLNLELKNSFNIHVVDNVDHADIYYFENGINYLFDRSGLFSYRDIDPNIVFTNVLMYRYLKRRRRYANILKQAKTDIFNGNEYLYFDIFQELNHIQVNSDFDFLNLMIKLPFVKSKFNIEIFNIEASSKFGLQEEFIYLNNEYAVFIDFKNHSAEDYTFAGLLIHALNEVLDNHFKFQMKFKVNENIQRISSASNNLTLDDLGKIFARLDFPVAVINNEALVMANELFLKLGVLPSRLVGKSIQEWLEIDDVFYQIKKSQVFEFGIIYIFTRVEKRKDSRIDHQSDLGIVTGSIAHELNNPVAGILAGLTLLELDEWDEENLQVLNDLKESASRAKGLIETFLSISKHNTKIGESKLIALEIDKALSLLRYRIIESGINLSVEQLSDLKDKDSKLIVLPIVLYLIFGELLTIFSHKRLVDKSLPKNLCLEMDFVNNALVINLKSFELSKEDEKKFHLKLIEHLMEMDAIKLKVTSKSIQLV